jgi:Bacteriophage Lambda NinG protein
MAKKCKNCGEPFQPRFSSLEKYCSKEDCRIKFALEVVQIQKKAAEKKAKKDWQEQKQKLRSKTTNWKNQLQLEINKIVRLIDKDLLCLARKKNGQMHAGHIYSRGSSPTIRFNLHNIHRQNAQSNHFQNDDGLLREGLISEYGQKYMDFISDLRQTPELKLKPFEYEQLTQKAKEITAFLSKLNLTYSLENRIILRNKYNLELGIYNKKYCVFK